LAVFFLVGLTDRVLTDLALTEPAPILDLDPMVLRLQVTMVDRTINRNMGRVETPLSRHTASNHSDSLLNTSTELPRAPSRGTAVPHLRILRSRNTVLPHRNSMVRLPSTAVAIPLRLASRATLHPRARIRATVPLPITLLVLDTKVKDMARLLLRADIQAPRGTEAPLPDLIRAVRRRCSTNHRQVRTRTHRSISSSTALFVSPAA